MLVVFCLIRYSLVKCQQASLLFCPMVLVSCGIWWVCPGTVQFTMMLNMNERYVETLCRIMHGKKRS